MEKRVKAKHLLFTLPILLVFAISECGAGHEFYVSIDGDDLNPGT
jgi:hypothetical protein